MHARMVRLALALSVAFSGVAPTLAAPGDWDRSYGQNGRITLAGVTFRVRDIERQPDGKIVAVGHTLDSNLNETNIYIAARYNADGSPDASFDGDGSLEFDFGSSVVGTVSLIRQSDGKIVIVGQAGPDWTGARLLRLNLDGTRDSSYGPQGEIALSYAGAIRNPHVELGPNNSALVIGTFDSNLPSPPPSTVVVTRVTSAGVLDTSFGTGGNAFLLTTEYLFEEQSVVAPDGKIIISGTKSRFSDSTPFIARLTSSGQTDTSFGGGVVGLPFLTGDGYVSAIAAAADGKVVVSGVRGLSYLARFNNDGTLDPTFGSSGRNIIAPTEVYSLIVESDNKIVIAGASDQPGQHALISRYNGDGSPDVTFGTRGTRLTDFATGNVQAGALLKELRRNSDGSYSAFAHIYEGDQPSYALVQFLGSGASAGVLGIRAESEGPGGGGSVLVYEGPPGRTHHVFHVYRSGGTAGAVSVQYRTVSGTAIAGQDFVARSGIVTLNDGETRGSFEIELIDDNIPETASEEFHVEIFGATGGAGISKKRASLSITSDNDFGSRMQLVTYDGAYVEGGTARIAVNRTGQLSQPMTVNYTLVAGTASAGSDYTGTGGSIQWPANEGGLREFSIPIVNDGAIESEEQFTVTFSDPSGTAGFFDTATVRITDNDTNTGQAMVAFSATTVLVDEGAPTATLQVIRLGDTTQALSVPWSLAVGSGAGAALAGEDYTSSSGTLNWAAGDATPKSISIALIDDSRFEGREYFSVSLNPTFPVQSTNGSGGTFIITDNDGTPTQPVASIGAGSSVLENAGTLSIPVTMSGLPGIAVRVDYSVRLSSAGIYDIGSVSGSVSWQPGDTSSKTIEIPIVQDTRDEPDEAFVVLISPAFSAFDSGGVAIGTSSAAFTIIDDDPTPAGQSAPVVAGVVVTSATTAAEGDQTLAITLRRVGDTREQLLVGLQGIAATAGDPDDFFARGGVLNWAANETGTKQAVLQINGDAIPEPTETLTMSIVAVSYDDLTGPELLVPITITDDDAPAAPAMVGFIGSTASISESAASTTVQVGRTGNTSIASSVDFTTATGTAGSEDFASTTGTLTWAANDTSLKMITVTLLPDTADEPNEEFTITLSSPSSGSQLGTATMTVTIQDDDPPPQPAFVGFSSTTQTVVESASSVTIQVTRTGNSAVSSSVNYAAAVGSASNADFTPASGTLTWAANDTAPKQIVINLLPDAVQESDETINVTLTAPSSGTQLNGATMTVTIVDDDTPVLPASVGFSSAAQSVAESATSVTVQVGRSGNTAIATSVDYAIAVGSASGADFTPASGTLTWAANDTAPKPIVVALLPDAVQESDETINLTLTNPSSGSQLVGATLTLTVVDDDAPVLSATVGFASTAQTVVESATSVSISVSRTGNTAVASSVAYATTAGTAGAADFTATSGTLSWAANDTAAKSIVVTLLPDTGDEPDETFTLTLSNPPSGTVLGTSSMTVTIQDDDLPAPPPGNGGGAAGGKKSGGSESLFGIAALAAILLRRMRRQRAGMATD